MITGQEWNIRKCLPQAEQKKLEAEADKKILKREREEQKIFDDWLKIKRAEGKLWIIHPRMDKPSTIEPGTPDYVLLLDHGRTLVIEMKVEGGKLSTEQRQAAWFLADLDHPVFVAWGHVQAIKFVQNHLNL